MNTRLVPAIAILLSVTSSAFAAPAGSKGKDWDERIIALESDVVVEVVAFNRTKNLRSGNTSSVVLYFNAVEAGRDGGDRANSEVRRSLTKAGRYTVLAVCDNTNADADSCTVSAREAEVDIFGKKK